MHKGNKAVQKLRRCWGLASCNLPASHTKPRHILPELFLYSLKAALCYWWV